MRANATMCVVDALAIIALIAVTAMVSADLSLPALFSDNMVLQQGTDAPVWGQANPGAQVTITCAGQTVEATADNSGAWRAELAPMEYGGPHDFRVTTGDGDSFECSNVYVGEVWLASGQSNMAMGVGRAMNAADEIASSENPLVRHFGTRRKYSAEPLDELSGRWEMAGPETTGHFTAAGYFFARTLQETLGVAVGVINSSWGGTPARAWARWEEIQSDPTFAPILENFDEQFERQQQIAREYARVMADWRKKVQEAKQNGETPPGRPKMPRGAPHRMPAVLYNGMIAPVSPYGIAGAIWYQGESDARPGQAELYDDLLTHLIEGWREDFDRPNLPFIIVQLPNFKGNAAWPLLREAQLNVYESLDNVGLAITIDAGMTDNIHPLNKQAVGRRLALWALGTVYGQDIVYSGPIADEVRLEGNAAMVTFDHAGEGLKSEEKTLVGFELAGEDGQFHPALGLPQGNTVRVSSPDVDAPVAVRYGWAPDPVCNLYNSIGLPASPFRSDTPDQ